MRNLVIKRDKSLVASFVTMKVYIEDRASSDIVIDNIPCRKLGNLKNGETKAFQIADEPARVYVIADKMSRNYCNDFYQLFYGTEDVFLGGKNKYNPIAGNPFMFHNNNNSEAIANRGKCKKKALKNYLLILLVCTLLGFVIGLFSGIVYGGQKNFSDSGMNITLTDDFVKSDVGGYTAIYNSTDIAVFALKEEFALLDGFEDYSLDDYAEMVKKANNVQSSNVKTENGLTGFEYDALNTETQVEYHYFTYVYKSTDAFWFVQFCTATEDKDIYAEQITQWAQSVSFE